MAPFGFIDREWLKTIGVVDRNFTHGQYENDIVMRALQDGGKVKMMPADCAVLVDHQKCHQGVAGTNFSKEGYKIGRDYLKKCWVSFGIVHKKRKLPFEPFTELEAGKWLA
jgi:GT2 family glycosyltransferase